MDLLDLYHAHEHSLSVRDDFIEQKLEDNNNIIESLPKQKIRKPKFVPWEPYKAAPSKDRKGEAPTEFPSLIPYPTSPTDQTTEADQTTTAPLVDTRKGRIEDDTKSTEETVELLRKEMASMSKELDVERKLNKELKNMFLTSLSDDLQSQVEALAGDKIQLGRRLEEYCEKMASSYEELEQLRIERDVWRCKFLAQSIRTDELLNKTQNLISILTKGQEWLRKASASVPLPAEARHLLDLDIVALYSRSPCDQRVVRKGPNYTNLTIACCKNCTGREIKLL